MNYRLMFLINAFIAVLLGLGFLIVPDRILGQFGVDGYAATRLLSQFFGTAMLGLGLLLWFAKDVTDANLQKGWTDLKDPFQPGCHCHLFIKLWGLRQRGGLPKIV